MNDFSRIAEIIRYLDSHRAEQPSLEKLAEVAGLSEFHFHRLFRHWAGVTPKDFLQCLTAAHARERLRESASVLDAALDAGLSGPGRLHDLMVTIDAASPGEIGNGGRDLVIAWGFAESPFGACTIGVTGRGICHIAFLDDEASEHPPADLVAQWPNATLERNDAAASEAAGRIFHSSTGSASPLRAFVRGTAFQLKVWHALLRIPEGELATYGRLAAAIGSPQASRAVGAACGANTIACLIPCHRVIRETGIVEGYRWGSTRKKAILARESARRMAYSLDNS